jgi:hypothetical protein
LRTRGKLVASFWFNFEIAQFQIIRDSKSRQ